MTKRRIDKPKPHSQPKKALPKPPASLKGWSRSKLGQMGRGRSGK